MISIYSLRPVYTFLHTIINGNVIASFVQKKKRFEKFFLRMYATLALPPSPLYLILRIYHDLSPSPLCVRTCGWPKEASIIDPFIYKVFFVEIFCFGNSNKDIHSKSEITWLCLETLTYSYSTKIFAKLDIWNMP